MSRPIGAAAVLAVLALTGLLLAGCGSGATLVGDPAPDDAVYPVVAVGQARSVLDAVQGALARGVAPQDTPAMVDARLLGPFRELELAQAQVAARRKLSTAAPAQVQRLRLIVPTSLTWPRFFVAVGDSSQSSTPVLQVLTSASARSPYGLWAEATMLPGSTLPPTAPDSIGSAAIAATDTSLVAAPQEVLAGFASYLNSAAARTASSTQFNRSSYSDQLIARLGADREALRAVATVSSTHSVTADPPFAVRTLDGGALVIGQLRETYLVKVKQGKGTVKVSDPDLAALANGKKQFSTSFTRTADEVLVFAVPPRGKGLITVIAAQKGDVGAVAK